LKVKLELKMSGLVLKDKNNQKIKRDEFKLSWVEERTMEEILKLSSEWIKDKTFLEKRIPGFVKVRESSLTIEPIDE